AVDSSRDVYIAGGTFSPNFPVTPGAYQTTNKGSEDAFAAKIPSPAASFSVTPSSDPVIAGTPFTLTVKALDADNTIAPGYRGTVHFTTSDPGGMVPPDYTFTATDNGVHTFSALLTKAGNQTITVTDTQLSFLTGSVTLTVLPAAADHLQVTAPPMSPSGAPFDVTLT